MKTKYVGIITMAVLTALLLSSPVMAQVLFSDNFEDGNDVGWTQYGEPYPTMLVAQEPDNNYVYSAAATITNEGRTRAGELTWTDYAVEVRVKVSNFNGSNRALVAGRLTDFNNYYAASLQATKVEIRKKRNGSSSTIANSTYTAPFNANQWYTLKMEFIGTTINVYVDGVPRISVSDSTNPLLAGQIGLIPSKVAAVYDDVVVSTVAPPGPEPTATPTVAPTATPTVAPTATATPDPSTLSLKFFVAPTGTASATGKINDPTTLESAIARILPGGLIYMRGGTYNYAAPIIIQPGNNGDAAGRTRLFAYAGETPILNFSAMAESSSNRGLSLYGNYWHVKGLIVEYAGDNGIFIGGNDNIVERCITRFNRDTGIQLSRYSSAFSRIDQWPSRNLILSCESHDNKDAGNENADGFAAKLTSGVGNVFRYCVAHNNIDDGWDLYTKKATGPIGAVTLEDCFAYHNGVLSDGSTSGTGDKNGFKLGGEDIAVNHVVVRSIAFHNGKHGFTYNRNLGTIEMTNNSALLNAERNFQFDGGTSVFTNNLSYDPGFDSDRIVGTDHADTNVWWIGNVSTNPRGLMVSPEDFASMDVTWSFDKDGSINYGKFLKLALGSDLIGAGTPTGTNIGARLDNELPPNVTPIPTEPPEPGAIPEPSTFLLIGLGLLGILALCGRKRR